MANALSAVSETALLTLKSRVVEAKRPRPLIRDDVGRLCLARLRPLVPAETRARILDRKLPASLTVYIALRARHYDRLARDFIAEHPDGLVVSLGAGFDTRYWRVAEQPWNYAEIDLPDVVAAKREILAERLDYPLIGRSVLDERWVEEVQALRSDAVLFLAEGLLMYFPRSDVVRLFTLLAASFPGARFAFEVVHARYTRGYWKKRVESRMKRRLGSDAGASYQFGVRHGRDVEALVDGLRVLDEWSYFDDPDIRPRILGLFRHVAFVAKTQWTIQAAFAA